MSAAVWALSDPPPHTPLPPNLPMQNTKSVPLGKAAENGHTQTVKRLLEGGANGDYQDKVSMHK